MELALESVQHITYKKIWRPLYRNTIYKKDPASASFDFAAGSGSAKKLI
jgi:hypothetical protein